MFSVNETNVPVNGVVTEEFQPAFSSTMWPAKSIDGTHSAVSSDSGCLSSESSVGYQQISEDDFAKHSTLYKCHLCECCKTDKQSLIIHFRSKHTGERPFRCDKSGCEKSFTSQAYLSQHEKTHSEIRPFKCDQIGCNKAFKCKPSLSQHEKTHSEIRPFKCDQVGCNKAFKTRPSLSQHKKCHLGRKCYKNKMNQLMESRMENHPKQRHRERNFNYLCDKCAEGFDKEEQLTLHLNDKHDIGIVFCNICDVPLENEDSRREHVMKYHLQQE